MERDEAVEIARQRALASGERGDHEYLPRTPEQAKTWMPHEWVIEAIMDAARNPGFYRREVASDA